MVESNSLIKASAGTGKTFALATRFIRQMMIDGVDPRTVVALTFSRAAAQEIYAKILIRLCKAATDEQGAANEWNTLLEDFRNGQVPDAAEKLAWIEAQEIPHRSEDFGRLLRLLVDTQHLGTIATIDSFVLRILKNFPKEMGFQNAVEVLDQVAENSALEGAVKTVLAKTGGAGEDVAEAFLKTKKGEYPRGCLSAINAILGDSGWRNFVIEHPESKEWTVESMCAALGVPMESQCPDLSGLRPKFCVIQRKNAISYEESFVQIAESYDASYAPTGVSEGVRKLMVYFWNHPEATKYEYDYHSKSYTFDCGAEGAAAIRGAIAHMMNLYLKRQIEIVKAKIDLVKAVEEVYERMTRRAGKLTFADFTKFSAENEFSERGIAIQNVQFRFDSQFDHWALDEFQDTSELQWKCLRELVKNAAEAGRAGESRSAMAVGDLKQSIYGWRGASAKPFEQLAAWEAFAGCEREFKVSHRYGPNTAAFVNKVFGKANIARGGIIPAACDGAVDEWVEGWMDHVSNEPADYVKVVGVNLSDGNSESDGDEMLVALHAEVSALWDKHEREKSKDTVGILVRSNTDGLKVAEYLREKELPVVWEGMSHVHDLPIVEAVLALLRLGIHPEDGYAWRTANDLFGVRELVLPDCRDTASVSAAISRLLARQGIARTLKDFCSVLRERLKLKRDGLACERLKQLVEMGVDYEARESAGDVDGFMSFLRESQKREIAASSSVIRILTIHRSKGLGIDHVFVPLFETNRVMSAIDAPSTRAPLYDGGDWVLSHLEKRSEVFNPKTSAAYESMRSSKLKEALRTYYVALTRSKKSLYVIMRNHSGSKDSDKGLLMSDLITEAVGGVLPYEAGEPPSLAVQGNGGETGNSHRPWSAEGVRDTVERCSPSGMSHGGERVPQWMKAARLFDADYETAVCHGIDVHAEYAKIEWVDAAGQGELERKILSGGFREAFVKPEARATVWRERSYELFDGRRWETGQFDRVVFTGEGAERRATIYDFKTNAKRGGETNEEFAERMRALYSPQMEAYRRAIGKLTGIAAEHINAKLLLETSGQAIAV